MIINTKSFVNAVNHALVAVAPRPPLPILAGVKLEAADGLLTVSGYDTVTQATSVMKASGDLPETLVNGALLKDVVSKSKAAQMTLTREDNQLLVVAGRAKVLLQTMPTDDYPAPLITPDQGFKIDGTGWGDLARSVAYAASKEDSLPVLTSINLIAANGQLTAQATDRYRLAENSVAIDGDVEGNLLVASKTVLEISRHLSPITTWEVRFDDSLIAVTDGNSQIIRSLVNGDFPPLGRIFPESQLNAVTASREDLADAISRSVALLDRNEPVLVTIEPGTITVTAGTGDKGAMTEQLDCEDYHDEPVTLRFNPGYLTDSLAALASDRVTLGWTDAVKPVSVSGDDVNHRQLVMPIRK